MIDFVLRKEIFYSTIPGNVRSEEVGYVDMTHMTGEADKALMTRKVWMKVCKSALTVRILRERIRYKAIVRVSFAEMQSDA